MYGVVANLIHTTHNIKVAYGVKFTCFAISAVEMYPFMKHEIGRG